jgi:hypothetical protein
MTRQSGKAIDKRHNRDEFVQLGCESSWTLDDFRDLVPERTGNDDYLSSGAFNEAESFHSIDLS